MIIAESKIEFIKNPVVGKFYKVPCARSSQDARKWIPVLPNKHSDPQFGAKEHLHYDLRFFSERAFIDEFGIAFLEFTREARVNKVLWTYQIPGGIEIKMLRRKCQRLTTGVNPQRFADTPCKDWYDKQIGKSCEGGICPHLKVPMIDKGEHYECPYHGLIGSKDTEKIIGNVFEIEL